METEVWRARREGGWSERRRWWGQADVRPQSDAVALCSPAFLVMEQSKFTPHPTPSHAPTHPLLYLGMQVCEGVSDWGDCSKEVMLCCKVGGREGGGRGGGGWERSWVCSSSGDCVEVSECERVGLTQQLCGERKRAGLVTWRLSLTLLYNELLQNGQETQRARRPSHPRNPICQGQRKEGAESKVQSGH